jgi:hypothetical protein
MEANKTTQSNESAPVSDPQQQQAAAELSEAGGTITFDAAREMAEAFKTIGTDPTPPPAGGGKEAATPPKEEAAPAPKEGPKVEPVNADALAEVLGGPALKKDEDETLPPELEHGTDKAKNAFVEQRRALKEERRKREELEARLAEVEKRTGEAAPEEVQTLRQQLDEYEQELRVARVEATREYKEAVTAPMEQIKSAVSGFTKKYEDLKEKDVLAAFGETDPDRQSELLVDLTVSMNDRDRYRVYDLAEKWQKVQGIREKVLANSKLALEKIEAHRIEQEKAFTDQQAKTYANALTKTWDDISAKAPIFRRRDGDEAWNAQIAEVEKFAAGLDPHKLVSEPQLMAGVAVRAATAPFLFGLVQTLYGQLRQAKQDLGKYQAATPGAGGGSPDPAIGTGSQPKAQYDDFYEAVRAGMRG